MLSLCDGNPLTKCHLLVCSMGGLVVKQMLYKAQTENIDKLVKNTVGVVCYLEHLFYLLCFLSQCLQSSYHSYLVNRLQVFYSCPHFGSKLADMPWRMGLVFRPAPTVSI